jgi:hypothetical protein
MGDDVDRESGDESEVNDNDVIGSRHTNKQASNLFGE